MRKRTVALAVAGVLCMGGFGTVACSSTSGGSSDASVSPAAKAVPGGTTAKDDKKSDKDKKDGTSNVRNPRVLHGEQQVRNRVTGQTITAVEQSGTVTAVSATSLTVRSSDGVTWTWKLDGDTHVITKTSGNAHPTDITSGDQVIVTGQRSGDTRTARTVSDPPRTIAQDAKEWLQDFKATHGGQGPGQWYNYGWNWDRPEPGSSADSSGS
jgi:hypothetical protein